ncbi:MobC family plasmid mobilization relaxosome protein [Pseudokineococcus sp. 5B2Z-1]|uniref:MobC family plasmid mobilization relaxosome protein n=1 Tax=Pseudokineococcus sp. 5B2Z-1 TaxID=3132744 RepID=UPI00403FB3C8
MTDDTSASPESSPGSGSSSPGSVSPWRALGRRRRANVPGGRLHHHKVSVTPEEEAVLVRLAESQGVTVVRLLVESAMAPQGETPAQRRAAMSELLSVHRQLAGIATNVNQLARHANAGEEFPPEARAVLARVRTLALRIDDVLDGIAKP